MTTVLTIVALGLVIACVVVEIVLMAVAFSTVPSIFRECRRSRAVAISWLSSVVTGVLAICSYTVWHSPHWTIALAVSSTIAAAIAVTLPEFWGPTRRPGPRRHPQHHD